MNVAYCNPVHTFTLGLGIGLGVGSVVAFVINSKATSETIDKIGRVASALSIFKIRVFL